MKTNKDDARRMILTALVETPFVLFFIYQLVVVWPQRPSVPDAAQGFTILTHMSEKALYVSTLDIALTFGALLTGMAIVLIGNGPLILRRLKGE